MTTPTSGTTYTATSTPLAIGGTASDNVGVTQVSWANSLGGSGTATGTTSWSASVALQSGSNVITVTARDAAGNTTTDTLTVTYAPTDTTAPAITMTDADERDDLHRDVDTARHRRNGLGQRGRDAGKLGEQPRRQRHGDGDDELVARALALQSGSNVITVTARDAAGNTTTDTLTVTYAPTDTTAPAITMTTPTSGTTYTATSTPLAIGGTASDNVGVTQVTLGEQPRRQRHGDGDDQLVGQRGAAVGLERHHGDRARRRGQHDDRHADRHLRADGHHRAGDHGDDADERDDLHRDVDAARDRRNGLGQRGRDAGDLGEQPRRQRHGDGDDELVGQRGAAMGSNVITVTARDAAGNTTTDTLTVTYAPADTTAPAITVTTPTSGPPTPQHRRRSPSAERPRTTSA